MNVCDNISLTSSLNKKCFKQNFRENQNTHISYSKTFLRNSRRLWDVVEKYGKAGQATDDNVAHVHCMLDN